MANDSGCSPSHATIAMPAITLTIDTVTPSDRSNPRVTMTIICAAANTVR